jgi:hypothetical protein
MKHATAHANESGHALIRSAEPGEDWAWCYVDEVAFGAPPEERAASGSAGSS